MRTFSLSACVLLLLSASASAAESPVAIPHFANESKSSGLNSIYKGDWQYMVGGGVAAFDCTGNGFPDLFFAGGENNAKLFLNKSKRGGKLKFEEVKDSGLELDHVTGAYPLDIDGDGIMDLVVMRVGESKVFKGLGDCKFADMKDKWNIDGGDAWGTAFSATWEKGNKMPTLAFGTYIDRKFQDDPWGHCTDNWMLRPNDTQDGYGARIPLTPSYCSLSMLFTDWNRSGVASLRVSNDREYYEGGQEQMWHVPAGAAPSLYTEAEGWHKVKLFGMGIATADINDSGYPTYFLSSMADQRMQMPADGGDKPMYHEAQFAMGTSAHKPYAGGDDRPSTGWHTQFEDVNNDGRYDLFIAKGNVDKMPDFAEKDPNNLLLQKPDGNFMEAGDKAGILSFKNHRGAEVVDLNLDGKLDIVDVARNDTVEVWRNISTDIGHFLEVKLSEDGGNVNGIGAWVEVKGPDGKTMSHENFIGGGHVSGKAGFIHFGLASLEKTQVRVIWPGGEKGEWQDVNANTFYVLEPGKEPAVWTTN